MPEIQDELERSILTTRKLLGQLPRAPSSDPRSEISTLLHAFTSDLLRHVEGVPDDEHSLFGAGIGLIQAIRPAQERFRCSIRDTAPNFKPFERGTGGKKQLPRPDFLKSEEGDEGEASDDEEDGSSVTEMEGSTNYGSLDLVGRKRKKPTSEVIYIDDVLDRAHRSVYSMILTFFHGLHFVSVRGLASCPGTIPLSFKKLSSTMLSRNGMLLPRSFAKLSILLLLSMPRVL